VAFFGVPAPKSARRGAPQRSGAVSVEFLHKHECAVCPLNNQSGLVHPHMKPTGAARPLAYLVGGAPGADEDRRGAHFVGSAGRLLRRYLPEKWLSKVRFNNVVRTRPPKDRDPSRVEVEACFPAGTFVEPIGPVKSSYKRWYDGPLVTVKTASGRILTGTPNHPVFTVEGETALKDLKIGDYAFCASASEPDGARRPDVDNKPARIDEVVEAFSKVAKMKRMRTSALDFHGDGIVDGEVDVVRASGELMGNFQVGAYSQEQFSHPHFALSQLGPRGLAHSGGLERCLSVLTMVAPKHALLAGARPHPQNHLLGLGPYLCSVCFEYFHNLWSAGFEHARELLGAFTFAVSFNDLLGGKRAPADRRPRHAGGGAFIPQLHSGLDKESLDCSPVRAGEPLEVSERPTLPVELDEIVAIEVTRSFRGHVYNLETGSHKYIADGFIVSNCRPSVARDIEESSPAAIIGFGNVPLEWATGETGISKWCGRRVPVLVEGRPYWFFPVRHPEDILRDPKRREVYEGGRDRYGSEAEFQFVLHVRAALEAIEAGLPEPAVHSADAALEGIEWVAGAGADDVEWVRAFLRRASRRKLAGVDYETNDLRPYAPGAKILTAAVATARDGALAFPLDHREARWTRAQRAAIDEAWREFLYEAECRKVAHNLTFEMEWSAHFYGKDCLRAGRWGDSLAQAYILDERSEGKPGAHSLEFLCVQYFGINIKKLAGVNRTNLDAEPLPKVLRYNGLDAKYHQLLYAEQLRALRAADLSALYAEHLERVPAAVLTQLKGVPVDQSVAHRLGKKYMRRMLDAERAMREMPIVRKYERAKAKKFRPSANEDVKDVLHGAGIHLDVADVEALAGVDHDFVREEVKWRKAAKIYGTYLVPVMGEDARAALEAMRRAGLEEIGGMLESRELRPARVYPDGLMHPQTNVNRVKTSRTSSDDPNYQNWPKRGAADAIEVRGTVRPLDPDEVVVSFDYGQIQARNVGMESLDRALLDAFWSGYDIHYAFMEHLARIYPRWVKEGVKTLARDKNLVKKYRNDVKHGFVFAAFFGAQPKKFAEVLEIPLSAAEKLADIFWDRFGGIRKWHRRLEVDYYRTGYVTGHAGYRRRAPVSYNERINSPIQADEAKIVLDAMIRLSKIDHDYLQANMEIHDDLTFIWPKKKVDELAEIVVREMLTVPFEWARTTPIVVEMSVGPDWASQKGAGEFASHEYDGIDMPRSCPI